MGQTVSRSPINKREVDVNFIGKIPPQACDLEEAIIGACLLDERAISDAIEILKTEDVFYKDAHQRIWRAMLQMAVAMIPIDLLTTSQQLRKNGDLDAVGGPYYLTQLSNKIGGAGNIEVHARIVLEKYIARKVIQIASNALTKAYGDETDPIELTESTLNEFDDLSMLMAGQGQSNFSEVVYDEVERLRKADQTGECITGTPTFSTSLDNALLGMQPGNLIIIAGRPGMGKTSVAWHIAGEQATNGVPVGFFSLEMSDRELIHKMIASRVSVDTGVVRRGSLGVEGWKRMDAELPAMAALPIQMNDKSGLTVNQIVAVGKNWIRKKGVKVIYIDYIGKIRTHDAGQKFGTREQEVSYIASRLKDFAKQMNVPVVLLAQLSRDVEKRGGDKRPMLSDLRESGAVEQEADVVIFPYRPEYYGIISDEDGNALPTGYTELDIAKYRSGQPGIVKWIFQAQYSRFKDFQESPF